MLTTQAFDAARRFIETSARPLEVALFQHEFDGVPAETVLNALRHFQNADGGFGHALEPDLRAPESSALCTSIAFQTLRIIKARPGNALVVKGIAWLLVALDQQQGHWRIIPETAEQSPRAPWWCQEGHKARFDSFALNPTAEILGYLYDYQNRVPDEILSLVSERVMHGLDGCEKIEMHELLCCLRLLKSTRLPSAYRGRLHAKLKELIGGTVACDPRQWQGYTLRPLQVVDGPGSPFMAELADAVSANLDYEIAAQSEEASWTPTWSWDGTFPEAWAEAQREWSGVITLEKLRILKRFGRIEGVA